MREHLLQYPIVFLHVNVWIYTSARLKRTMSCINDQTFLKVWADMTACMHKQSCSQISSSSLSSVSPSSFSYYSFLLSLLLVFLLVLLLVFSSYYSSLFLVLSCQFLVLTCSCSSAFSLLCRYVGLWIPHICFIDSRARAAILHHRALVCLGSPGSVISHHSPVSSLRPTIFRLLCDCIRYLRTPFTSHSLVSLGDKRAVS